MDPHQLKVMKNINLKPCIINSESIYTEYIHQIHGRNHRNSSLERVKRKTDILYEDSLQLLHLRAFSNDIIYIFIVFYLGTSTPKAIKLHGNLGVLNLVCPGVNMTGFLTEYQTSCRLRTSIFPPLRRTV